MRDRSSNAQTTAPIYDELSRGNGQPFWDARHDDLVWRTLGEGSWSGEFQGKQTIIDEIFRPLNRALVERVIQRPRVADGAPAGRLCRQAAPCG